MSDLTLSEEYANAVERDRARRCPSCGPSTATRSTSPSRTRRRSRRSESTFDAWAAGIPELQPADGQAGRRSGSRPGSASAQPARARPRARRRRRPPPSVARRAAAHPPRPVVVTPVSISTQRAPTARAAARSVPIPSPIITASSTSRPTASAASSSRCGDGLPMDQRRHPGRGLDRGGDRAGARTQTAFGRIDRVAVRGDEPGTGTDAIGGRRQPQVREVRIEPGHDRVRGAGRRPAIDALLVHPRRGMPRRHDLQPDVAQLALETAGPEHEHAADPRLVSRDVERRRRARTRRRVSARDRRAHRRRGGSRSRRGSASSCS